jgi:hypothetical protein
LYQRRYWAGSRDFFDEYAAFLLRCQRSLVYNFLYSTAELQNLQAHFNFPALFAYLIEKRLGIPKACALPLPMRLKAVGRVCGVHPIR